MRRTAFPSEQTPDIPVTLHEAASAAGVTYGEPACLELDVFAAET